MLANNDVSRELCEKLNQYQELLFKWNKKINLISRNSENDIWQRHFIDSLQLLKLMNFSDRVIDIGAGGGFPGIVLSIGGIKDMTLVECDSRKVAFLRQVAKISMNKITIIEQKIDANFIGNYDILTCRGFSSLANILQLTRGITIIKKILLLKGENYKEEITEAQKEWLFNIELHDSITSDKSCILEISNVRKLK